MFDKLDKILNQQVRLAVVSVLINLDSAEFKFLLKITKTTQGNLSHQLKVLQEAGYIDLIKTYKNNYPNTRCKLTKKGLSAFEKYVESMKEYLNLENNKNKLKELV